MTYLTLQDELKNNLISNFKTPIDQLVISDIIQNPNLNGINSADSIQIKNSHRNNIVKKGRADFDSDSDGLTASQKVDLYGYYYFQMHFTSSYVFYFNEFDFLKSAITNKHVYFIDVGCGPFTSGLAFNSILSKFENDYTNATYIGIDTSKRMLEKAESVYNSVATNNFKHAIFNNEMNRITDELHLMTNQNEEVIFILNYSYLFASHTLVVDEFVSLTKTILTQFCKTDRCNLIVLYQNPKTDSLNVKWNEYKTKLVTMKSLDNYPKSVHFKFDDVLNSSNYPSPEFQGQYRGTKSDILISFS